MGVIMANKALKIFFPGHKTERDWLSDIDTRCNACEGADSRHGWACQQCFNFFCYIHTIVDYRNGAPQILCQKCYLKCVTFDKINA